MSTVEITFSDGESFVAFPSKLFADYYVTDEGPEALALDTEIHAVNPDYRTELVAGSSPLRRTRLQRAGLP